MRAVSTLCDFFPSLSALGAAFIFVGAAQANDKPLYELREETAAPAVALLVLSDTVGGLEATVAPALGGEMSGLRVRYRGEWLELLHRARDFSPTTDWQGRAPILWPAVGRTHATSSSGQLQPDTYRWQGRDYPMPPHGFAKDRRWHVVDRQCDARGVSVTLRLENDAETRRFYPFSFRYDLTYRVHDGRLEIASAITSGAGNPDPMFFSVGNHITFRIPLVPGSDPAALHLQTPCTVLYLKDARMLPTGEQQPLSYREPTPVSALTTGRAISVGGYEGDPWALLTDPSGLAVRLSHHAARLPAAPLIQFNLWGEPATGCFAPEPWVGLQNSLNLHQGLVELPAGQTWHWMIQLDLERPDTP